ncbi:PHB depolymerase family esterase [Methylocystis sp. B8]|uniref:extracellular catalytic domain type 1 short-chain-length polyhydroxyalkanoate depolymerase n=1 Tax=Methylocystis sp. B8 TaxID=544938 RepID=UPI0014857977|nr:PHB depolymerase family esterase [Methylocystis sp. B8]
MTEFDENCRKRPLQNISALATPNQDAQRSFSSISTPANGAYPTRTFHGEHGAREYSLYLPNHIRANAALIVMLHGCGQTSHDFSGGTNMNLLAERHGFVVAYPCQALDANRMRCWNWYKPGHQRRDSGEPSIIAGITRQVIQDFEIDHDHVYIAGLSAGGAMAAVLTATYPELYAAAGIHSGLPYGCAVDLESALRAMRGDVITKHFCRSVFAEPVRTIVFHGTDDCQVHPCNSNTIFAQACSIDSTSSARFVGEGRGRRYFRTSIFDGSCAPHAEHWLVEGLGHAWSGGCAAASHTDSNGPDASAEMIRFFLEGRFDPIFVPVRDDLEWFQHQCQTSTV